jgi:methyl-accepting chemotaxis protein
MKHGGDFRTIVDGVNKTLDNVISPLNVAAEYVDRIAKGDIPPKITENYNGDFNEIKNNLNSLIDSLNDVANIANEISKGNLNNTIILRSSNDKLMIALQTMTDAVNLLVEDASMLATSANEGKLDIRADTANHHGDFKEVIAGVNKTLDNVIGPLNVAAEYVDRISKGDIPPKITDNYKGDFNEIKNNLNGCIDAVNAMISDVKDMGSNLVIGKLRYRAEASKHSGDFKEIIEGINLSMDAVVLMIDNLPIPAMAIDNQFNILYINEIGAQLDNKKGKELEGTKCYNHLRTSHCQTNECACAITIHNNQSITKDTDAHPGNHNLEISYSAIPIRDKQGNAIGAFEVVMDQTEIKNNLKTIEKAAEIQNKIAEYQNKETVNLVRGLNKLAIGDFTAKVDFTEPDKDTITVFNTLMEIKSAINLFVDAVIDLRDDTQMLAKSALEGKLDTRANTMKHSGDFREIIAGVNKTLDHVIGPLNVAAEYVDRISKGDIPPKISDEYKGDFNEIKNNLNQCIDAVNSLVKDVLILVKATEEGQLSTRAAATKHFGDFREIIEGFNKTLNYVIEPINEAGQVLEIMSTGNFTARMKGEYKGDNQKLKHSINTMGNSLSDVISMINQNVQTTAGSAFEISATAESLASASQEQSSQTDEVAGAVEEMSRTVAENAMSANRTADLARKSGEIATNGANVVKQTVNKMKDIADVVKTSANNIQKLGDSSKEIGEIISVIDDIADQTNLLALNAAIEAARAGEQGRGFAVVADEVRKLAERTTEATKQIAKMIKGIQAETDQAVVAMNRGTLEVQNGIDLADKAGESLNHILTSTRDVLDMINQIAAASEEQSATSEQISKNVLSISKVTGESAQRIEDVAHTSEELAKLTEQLRNLMAQFQVESDESYSYTPTKQFGRKDRKHLPA